MVWRKQKKGLRGLHVIFAKRTKTAQLEDLSTSEEIRGRLKEKKLLRSVREDSIYGIDC